MNYFLAGSKMEDSVEEIEANKRQKVEEQPAPMPLFNIEGSLIEKNGEPVEQLKSNVNLRKLALISYENTIFVYKFIIDDLWINTGHVLSKNLLTLEIIKRKMKDFLRISHDEVIRPMNKHINAPVFNVDDSRNILMSFLEYRDLMKDHPGSAYMLPEKQRSVKKHTASCKDAFRHKYNINYLRDRNNPGLYDFLETASQTLLLELFDYVPIEASPYRIPYDLIEEMCFFTQN